MIVRASTNPLCYDCPACRRVRGHACDCPERVEYAQRQHAKSVEDDLEVGSNGQMRRRG